MEWPDFFPFNCPPDNAQTPQGEVFRFTDRRVPREKDFISYQISKPGSVWPDPCIACGLSVYTDINDIPRVRKRVPPTRKKWVARGILEEKDGLIALTKAREPSHHTWWVAVGLEPWAKFTALLAPDKERTV